MSAARRVRRTILIAAALSGALAGCERKTIFYLNVTLLDGTKALQVDSFLDDSPERFDSFTIPLDVDGGLVKTVGFEVRPSIKSLRLVLTAYNASNCTATVTWSDFHSGHVDSATVAFNGPFKCAPDGGDEAGSGDDAGVDADGGSNDTGDTMGDRSMCPAPSDPDAAVDAGAPDAGDGGDDSCQTYCRQIFAVCRDNKKVRDSYRSVPDCLLKCGKIARPSDPTARAQADNTMACLLRYLATEQCDEVTLLGGMCGSECANYRFILAQTCGVADAACDPFTIQDLCVRAALEAARDPAWCVQAARAPGCTGCAP